MVTIHSEIENRKMTSELGRWAIIDIETSGINPSVDSIIDVGYILFEGTRKIKEFSSLVRYPQKGRPFEDEVKPLSQFIQKLTGITSIDLKLAPEWSKVCEHLHDLEGATLIAHNKDFEFSFLSQEFSKKQVFVDSIDFLGMLNPEKNSLSLESFISELGIKEKEDHRGLEDSLDLLKVLLLTLRKIQNDRSWYFSLQSMWENYNLKDHWWAKFSRISIQEISEIEEAIQFDCISLLKNNKSKRENEIGNEFSEKKYQDSEFSTSSVQGILKDEEYIQHFLPGYQYRIGQEQMALRVGQSFKNEVHALIEAPTGTGKTLAYLIPSILYNQDSKEQILISTGTKALQHQAYEKDIPKVKKILSSSDLKVAVLVGTQNHFCELIFRSKQKEKMVEFGGLFSKDTDDSEKFSWIFFEMLFFKEANWGLEITRDNTPQVLRYKWKEFSALSSELAVDFRSCVGGRCPLKSSCSYISGIKKAKEADVIIGNHALMLTWPKGIPRPSRIIVDEAHRLEGEATRAFTKVLTDREIDQIIKTVQNGNALGSLYYLISYFSEDLEKGRETISHLQSELRYWVQDISSHLEAMISLGIEMIKKRPKYSEQYWNELFIAQGTEGRVPEFTDSLMVSFINRIQSISAILTTWQKEIFLVACDFENKIKVKGEKEENVILAFARFNSFFEKLEETLSTINSFLSPKDLWISVFRYHEQDGPELCSIPINVGKIMHDEVLQKSLSVVFTSATLGGANNKWQNQGIDWAIGHIFLPPEKRFKSMLSLPSVYDYQKKCRVYFSSDVPPLYDSLFVEKTLKEIIPLIKKINGRSLLLYSSKMRFEEARERLLKNIGNDIPLFIQGMGINVVEEFKKTDCGILLGMESFGEGIDIPGNALQFVYIDKVPDLRQDIITEKRREFYEKNFGQEFCNYFLAYRSRSLLQKIGRLLRTTEDSGCVIITDARLKKWNQRTLKQFTEQLYPYSIYQENLHDACELSLQFILGESQIEHFSSF